jgi:hypothetical protein
MAAYSLSERIGNSYVSSPQRKKDILDLFAEDSWRRAYAGELEMRPPGAPATGTGPHGAEPTTIRMPLASHILSASSRVGSPPTPTD